MEQQLIDQRLIAANRKKFSYNYQVGDEVLKQTYSQDKLSAIAEGPYPIETVPIDGRRFLP